MADPTPTEAAILAKLERVAQGLKDPFNPFEDAPSQETQFRAATQLVQLRQAIEDRTYSAQGHALAVEKQTHDIEASRARLSFEQQQEKDRVDLEYAKLEIQKAEVIVRLLEAAGKNPDMVSVVKDMAGRLLEGGSRVLQIEEKA